MVAASMTPPNAEQLLRQSPIPALRRLQVEETDQEIVLTGSVGSYYLKQLAQESVRPILGPRRLLNYVNVIQA